MPTPPTLAEACAFERASGGCDIEAMMKMALEGRVSQLRRWASVWLKENCNVKVVIEELSSATQAAANNL